MKNNILVLCLVCLSGCGLEINKYGKKDELPPFWKISPFLTNRASVLNGKILSCFDKAICIKNKPELYGDDYWQSPKETEKNGYGDCEDKAIYLKYLLDIQQIDSQLCIGFYNLVISGSLHAWIEVKMNKNIYILDPCYGTIISQSVLKETSYAPVYGHKEIYNKIKNYRKRTGYNGNINEKYDVIHWAIFRNKWADKVDHLNNMNN